MKFKVLQSFHDIETMGLVPAGSTVDWEDKARIKAALDRGLIAEIEAPKPESKPEPKPAQPKKKATKKK